MNTRKLAYALAFAAAFGGHAAHATDVALPMDGQWYLFDVSPDLAVSGGMEWIDLAYEYDGSALSFSFNGPAILTVVDGGFSGDSFEVFDNGVSIGFSIVPVNSYPNSVGLDFDAAMADGGFGGRTYTLGAGSHVITGLLAGSALDDQNMPLNATVGGVMLAPVPEPETYALMLAGLGLVGFAARRRAK